MQLFESTLTLLLLAVLLLQLSRGLPIPYPTILALAGAIVAALPWAPEIGIDPQLALALFIAPALLDAAFDLPPRSLRTNWRPLMALAGMAVVLTTAAVAFAGVVIAGLPLAAAIALGAIVSPPDAAAATATLGRFSLPRRTVIVLKGESLLNDAVALLIFTGAVASASYTESLTGLIPQLALAAPGGVLLGIAFGKIYVKLAPLVAGTLGGRLLEFVTTFGVWIIAERLHLSAILCVVAYAMTIARYLPERTLPRDRIHSYAVWETAVFLLNVFAFLLMGLQARAVVRDLGMDELSHTIGFAAVVLAIVIGVRVGWVMLYNQVIAQLPWLHDGQAPPTRAQGILVAWCGMRGLVTLATALALPMNFPGRDVILLSALAVVLGTLVIQGLTLAPLIRILGFPPDTSFDDELAAARIVLVKTGIEGLDGRDDEIAERLRVDYQEELARADEPGHPRTSSPVDRLRRQNIKLKRRKLNEMRRSGEIEDDVYHALEQELDFIELAVSPPDRLEVVEG